MIRSLPGLFGRSVGQSFVAFAADIKLAHSVFALPFAASVFFIGDIPMPSPREVGLLLVAMVAARSFAMGMNRYLDRDIDAQNPRTQARMIPSGALSANQGLVWSLLAAVLFIAAASSLSSLAGWCAVPMLVILMSYSYMKRLSWLTHWYLGACLGLAPIAVQIALQGRVELSVLLLGLAVALWTAGFDILYSLQDLAFDRQYSLRSVPGAFGPQRALWISRGCFALMTASLACVGYLSRLHGLYFCGVAIVAMILAYEHWLVRDAAVDGRSTNINLAFFNLNAYVSILFLGFLVADYAIFT